MNGFLPLIEAFLAFALTMRALATAVSPVVGVWMRLFRWRALALGLRQSLELIHDKEIQPRLTIATRHPPGSTDRLGFLTDMTTGPSAEVGVENGELWERRIQELGACLQKAESKGALQQCITFLYRRIRRWHSFRFGLDCLREPKFQARLEVSRAGSALASWAYELARCER